MRSHAIRLFVICLCCMLGLSLSIALPTSAKEKPILVRVGHQEPPDSQNDHDCHVFSELVYLKSNGRIEVKVFPASLLGKGVSMLEAVQAGSQDITFQVSPVIGLVKEARYWDLPHLFEDRDAVTRLVTSPLMKWDEENYRQKNLVLLGYFDLGYRHLANALRPVHTPEDLKGMKVRVAAGPTKVLVWKSFGASPTPWAYAEAYQALKQGVFDGIDSVMTGFWYSKFYEVTKYLTLTEHVYNPQIMVAGKPFWDRLPEWARPILKEAAQEAAHVARYANRQAEANLVAKLAEKGMEVNELTKEEKKLFRQAGQPAYDEYEKIVGKARLQEIVKIAGTKYKDYMK
jgi:tripartite ATP-independent transporter DctP family solute receptor